jgi:outer membrane cobalamin receptor
VLVGLHAASPVFAQNQSAPRGVVRGTVTDAETGDPLIGASVALWRMPDSTVVTGGPVEEKGAFHIEGVPAGTHEARVSFVGYETKTVSDVTIDGQNREVDLGEIALREAASEMDEVVVSGERAYMEVQAGKTVYNTQDQPVTAGGSARDVLENLPSVEVGIEGNISLRGSQNVAIHLGGKPAPMSGEALTSFLEGLAAEDIKRVEVIPNPSARDEPEGVGGIINIVLTKDREGGWGGGVSAGAGTRGGYNGSANAHYGGGPWNLFANYSLRYHEYEYSGERFLEQHRPAPDAAPLLDQESTNDHGGLANTLNTDLSYQLSEKNALSLSTVFSYRQSDDGGLTRYVERAPDEDPMRRYTRETDGERSDFGMDYRLSFERVMQPQKHTLSVEARYDEDREEYEERHAQRLLPTDAPGADGTLSSRQRTDEDETEREATLQADYRRPLGESAHLETGFKSDAEWLSSDFYSASWDSTQTLTPDPSLSNTFDYAEQIHAAYGILGGSLGDVSAQGGLRVERALTTFDQQTLGETFDNNYFSLFPSGHLSYKPTQSNTFKVSYSKRVRRPHTGQLNPFGDYDDPTFIYRGNPDLKPEYTHSLEAGYSRLGEKYTLRLTPYYRHTTSAISRHEQTTPEGVTVLTFENFATEDSYGTELVGSLTLGKWLKGNASLNAYKRVTDGSNLSSELSSGALGFRTRASLTSELGRGVTLQLSQHYRSPMDIPGGRIASSMRTNAALKKELLSGRASLSLRASDVFSTTGFEMERDRERYYQVFSREANRRGLSLSFRYNFGREDKQRRGQQQGNGESEGGGMGM